MEYYNDPDFDYDRYWHTREYEHHSEVIAIRRLLNNQHFDSGADIGGGFGRLTQVFDGYCRQVILVEPSQKMRDLADKYLRQTKIKIIPGIATKTNLETASQDLVTAIRVLHHLPDLDPVMREFARILNPHGTLLIEFANSYNFKARVRSFLSGRPILNAPIDLRSAANIKIKAIPFVNHHPSAVLKSLRANNFQVEKIYSVSNFRSPIIKKFAPLKILVGLESLLQPLLGPIYFGPSIFIMARRVDKNATL